MKHLFKKQAKSLIEELSKMSYPYPYKTQHTYLVLLISRRDFNELYYKYRFPENSVLDVIEKAKDSDALVLKVSIISGRLHVFSAKILNEGTEELFGELLKKGVDAL